MSVYSEAKIRTIKYRYFLVEVVTSGNGHIGCSTIKALDAAATDHDLQSNGGTATAVAYTVHGSFPVTNVNDGNDSSFTTSAAGQAGSGHGILVDLGAAESIVKLGFRSRSDAFGAAEAVVTGFVKAKVNIGDSHTTLHTISETNWANNEYREWVLQ